MSDALRRQKDRATQLLAKGKVAAALEEFQRIVKAVPGDLGVRQKVAELLAKQGRKSEAVREYGEVVKRYAEQGQFFKASALCRVVLTLEPGHVETQKMIAMLYAERGVQTPGQPSLRIPGAKPSAPLTRAALTPMEMPAVQVPPPAPADADLEIDIAIEEIPIELEAPPPPPGSLPRIPLFSDLRTEEFIAILNEAMEARSFGPGERIVTEGEQGQSMFALAEGHVAVLRTLPGQPPKKVATMDEGDFFGEMALLSKSPRLATVVAETDVVVLEFSRHNIERIIARYPGVGQGIERFYRDRLLANLLRSSPLLHPLPEETKRLLATKFQPRTYQDGETILEEGTPGEAVYLLLRGKAAVLHRTPQGSEAYPEMREGDAFGEISVALQLPVSTTVKAKGTVVTLRLPAADFKEHVLSNGEVKKQVLSMASERLTRTAQHMLASEGDLRI